MAFPVDNTRCNLTGKFGPRPPIKLSNGGWSGGFHGGIDLAPEVRGTALLVYSVIDGVIESTGRKHDAGNYIIIRRANGDAWRYCHLSSVAVRTGDRVKDGQPIGRMGATGNVNGVHLHLEVYPDRALRIRVDPLPLIWYEWNPAKDSDKASTPTPAPKPQPKPKPQPRVVRLRSQLDLTAWTAYVDSRLRFYQYVVVNGRRVKRRLNGRYTVIGIYNGNFKVRGPGGDAWVHGSAKAGLV